MSGFETLRATATGDPRVAAYVAQSGRDVFPMHDGRPMARETRALWHWWRDAATEGVPPRDSFDIADHPQLIPNLYLIEPVSGGYRLRLAGERFEQMFNRRRGHEWRHDAVEPLARAFAGYFDFVRESGRAWHSTGRMRCEWSDWFRFESLLCPLRHVGGDQLLGIAVTMGEE